MIAEKKKEYAASLLRKKAEELNRVPKKADFEPLEISHIKAYLGPWPRALEYAGLKQAKPEAKKSKKRSAGKVKAHRETKLKKEETECSAEE